MTTVSNMKWISFLEKRFGSWAIPNLTVYLIAYQIIGVVLLLGNYMTMSDMFLHGSSILDRGEWWRLATFMMMPKTLSPIWLMFALYIFYLIGSALEHEWGSFRFNLFILFGYLLTVAMAFINPGVVISNIYLFGSVFLAFATLFPNFELYIFFVLPVKVKWLGWLMFAYYAFTLLMPSAGPGGVIVIGSKLGVVAAFVNYALFFGEDFIHSIKAGRRRKNFASQAAELSEQPKHQCSECGATDKSHPTMLFRYCSTCGKCYCEEHIGTHSHE